MKANNPEDRQLRITPRWEVACSAAPARRDKKTAVPEGAVATITLPGEDLSEDYDGGTYTFTKTL